MYTRLQTVWSLPGPSRQANKGHSPRCHCRPNGPGRLADKVVQPTTQSAEGCTSVPASFSTVRIANTRRNQMDYDYEILHTLEGQFCATYWRGILKATAKLQL